METKSVQEICFRSLEMKMQTVSFSSRQTKIMHVFYLVGADAINNCLQFHILIQHKKISNNISADCSPVMGVQLKKVQY